MDTIVLYHWICFVSLMHWEFDGLDCDRNVFRLDIIDGYMIMVNVKLCCTYRHMHNDKYLCTYFIPSVSYNHCHCQSWTTRQDKHKSSEPKIRFLLFGRQTVCSTNLSRRAHKEEDKNKPRSTQAIKDCAQTLQSQVVHFDNLVFSFISLANKLFYFHSA